MSRALVVFESMYGNNQKIADAIADGIRSRATVDVHEVGTAPITLPSDVSLLVVGGPNHAAGMSRAPSRKSAADRSGKPTITGEIGLREWFDRLELPPGTVAAVAYDTRMAKPRFLRWFDRASSGIEKRLRERSFTLASAAEHFYVTGEQGPLAEGEIDRAGRWGETLARHVTSTERVV